MCISWDENEEYDISGNAQHEDLEGIIAFCEDDIFSGR
jgi:hypothetical protein